MSDTVLFQALVYLLAAVLCVPLARRAGLGSVLGYLCAGVLVGPHVLGLVGQSGKVMHFAEFGVVMMLFLVGLELRPALLWSLRKPLLGMGGLQVLLTAGAVAALAVPLGLSPKQGLALGLIAAMSSTAIVLQTLAEKGLLKTAGGQASFSILLFQDLAVIPILAVFPLLGSPQTGAEGASGAPAWRSALEIVAAVGAVIAVGRFGVRPALRWLAQTRLREVFTASALLLVVAIAWLMMRVGLSPALGTFLAGVVLADSEYRHELESDIEPFKGLLLGVFFVSVGAEIDFGLVRERPLALLGLVTGALALKTLVLWPIARRMLDARGSAVAALGLAQVGEFGFVLVSFAAQNVIFDAAFSRMLTAAIALSMLATPALFVLLERVVLPRLTAPTPERPADNVAHDDAHVVVAGFGRVGQVVVRMLRMAGHGVTVLDLDPEMVDLLGRLGQKVYYGDASRLDLLVAAGVGRARLFVLAVDEPDKSVEIAQLVRRHFTELPILARARNRAHHYRLRAAGVKQVFRETMGTSLELGSGSLRALGMSAHRAHRAAQRFKQHDVAALEAMERFSGQGQDVWLSEAKKALAEMEASLRAELSGAAPDADAGWDNDTLRAEVAARAGG